MHESSAPTNPSSWVKDLDPLVERVILRCLEKDPGRRLASAKQVADALPGGDPLAAALALGETPSPEMVAAAGSKTGMKPSYAVACLVVIIAGILMTAILVNKTNIAHKAIRANSPDVLTQKAREIIQHLGYTDPPVDRASGFFADRIYADYIKQKIEPSRRWEYFTKDWPSAFGFWYRQSPRYLSAQQPYNSGWITENDPPTLVSGMVTLELDTHGRLIKLNAVPPQRDESQETSPPDWTVLFAAAELDLTRFTPTKPQWTTLATSDARAAWTGTCPNAPEIPLRIEAAAWRGKPIYFQLIWPWTTPSLMQARQETMGFRIVRIFVFSFMLALVVAAALLARHNFRRGRGDRRGAFKLAAFSYFVMMLSWVFGADHTPVVATEVWSFLLIANGQALLAAAGFWLGYLALEPYARRRWPVTLISWGRLLSGKLRDPLVGRDLLVGMGFGLFYNLLLLLSELSKNWLGEAPSYGTKMDFALGARQLIGGSLLRAMFIMSLYSLFWFFSVLLLRILTRRQWLTVLVWALIMVGPGLFLPDATISNLLVSTLRVLLIITVMLRFGLLALVSFSLVVQLVSEITTDFSAWYGGISLTLMIAVLSLTIYAFHTALGGQKVFAGKLLEE